MLGLSYVPVLAQLGEDFFQNREGAAEKCPGNNGLCLGWIADNFGDYVDPLWEHVLLSIVPLAIGFLIATGLALFAHRYRILAPFFLFFVGTLFTIPSIAFYLILLNITGRGFTTAVVVLTAYTQVLIYRNVMTGLQEVPREAVDVAEGMGLTRRQSLTRVELPLAVPAIIAGVRVATVTTISLATIAAFITPLGLGAPIFSAIQTGANTEFVAASLLAIALALIADVLIVMLQRVLTPWVRARSVAR